MINYTVNSLFDIHFNQYVLEVKHLIDSKPKIQCLNSLKRITNVLQLSLLYEVLIEYKTTIVISLITINK